MRCHRIILPPPSVKKSPLDPQGTHGPTRPSATKNSQDPGKAHRFTSGTSSSTRIQGMQKPLLDLRCTPCCDDHAPMCDECDEAAHCPDAAESIICYDPHCVEPPCEQDHMSQALSFGILPCCPVPSLSARCCTTPTDTSFHDPAAAAMTAPCSLPSTCTYDMCARGLDLTCHEADVHHAQPCEQDANSGNCVSVCDGYVRPWHACSTFGLNNDMEFAYPQGAFDPCCAPCTDPVSCHAPCFDVPPSFVTMTPRRSAPSIWRSSEEPSVSGTSCSTPTSHPYPNTPDQTDQALDMLSCRWNGCGFQVPSMQELSLHMHKTHVPDMDVQSIQHCFNAPIPLDTQMSMPDAWALKAPKPLGPSPTDAGTGAALESQGLLDNVVTACLCPLDEQGKKQHACGWVHCTESFDTHAELTAHIAEVHVGSGKTEYECGWVGCERAKHGRKFQQKQKVLRHIQTHTGDRPYVCSVCHKRFSETSTLTQHMRTHTNERPYKCDFPGCNKSFSVIGSLTIHKRTHTGDRPFKCPYPNCHRQFSESSNLNKHLRVHSGDKPFECPECKRRFSRPDQRARHRKIHAKQVASTHAASTSSSLAPSISMPRAPEAGPIIESVAVVGL